MKSVDILDQKWLDLVFEGRNQKYGAYQLRRESPTTTLFAFLIGVSIVAVVMTAVLLSRTTASDSVIYSPLATPVELSNIELPQPKPQEPTQAAAPVSRKQEADENQEDVALVDPEVVRAIDAEQNIAPNNQNNQTDNEATGSDLGIATGSGGGTTTSATTNTGGGETGAIEGPRGTATLDKQPEFPGGINKFYNYISRNFAKPEIDNHRTIKVYVSFVIEKDGTMTEIKVPNDPGYGLGKEAIRVLKSLKTKWKPGIYKGQPVRTAYSLPVVVVMN